MNYAFTGRSLTFAIDQKIYDEAVVYKCLYWYTGRYQIDICKEGDLFCITLEIPEQEQLQKQVEDLVQKISRDLIDFKLRQIVINETKTIRELIVAKAFSHYDTDNDPDTLITDPVGFKPEDILNSSERESRKFKEARNYDLSDENEYFLLPFRFHRMNSQHEILVNEVGDFFIAPTGTVTRIVNKSVKKDEELYADLVSKLFISESPIPPLINQLAIHYRTKKSFLDHFTSLHIFVISLRCEHTCHYCQVSRASQDRTAFDMQQWHIDKGIEMMMRSPNPNITMEFQGGEALLAFDNIVYAIEKTKSEAINFGKTVTYVICTNLALVTDEILNYCRENRVLISTSLDGPAHIHNANRHRQGQNSYELAMLGINKSRAVLGQDQVSALLTTSNLSLNYPREIIDEYVQLGFKNIFLRPISPYGFATKNEKKNHYDMSRFLDFYKKGISRIIEHNINGRFLREDYAALILKKILTPFPVGYVDLQSPAGMTINVIVFNYDGKIYATDESRMLAEMNDFTFQLGSLDTHSYQDIFYGEKVKHFSLASINESLPGCSDCAFQSYCGADPVFHYATQGDMIGHRPTSGFCQRNMEIIRHLFELLQDKRIEHIFRTWLN